MFIRKLLLFGITSLSLFGQISFDTIGQRTLTAPPSKTPADQKCTVQGQVTNSLTGAPVKKATVSLQLLSGKPSDQAYSQSGEGYSTTSEADGSFSFTLVEPGEYKLSGVRAGFLTTEFGSKDMWTPGVTLSLKPTDKKTGLSLTLVPQGTISGRIVDEDGDPVPQVTVMALRPTWANGRLQHLPLGFNQTNDLGEFRLSNLSPGKYFVSAQRMGMNAPLPDSATSPDKPDMRSVRTFYPQVTSLDKAAPIEVQPGQEMSGINMQLATVRTYHVRGTVVGDAGQADVSSLQVSVGDGDDMFAIFSSMGNSIKKDRTFDIAGVRPGSHTLSLMDMKSGFRKLASQSIEVGSADLDSVALQIVSPGAIHGQIVIQGDPPPGTSRTTASTIHPMLMGSGSMFAMTPDVNVKEDGKLSIESVFPGKYFVQVAAPSGTYLKSVKFQRQDVTGQELDLSQNPSGELDIVFHYNPAEVSGNVKLSQEAGSSPATQIALIPEVLTADMSGVETGQTDQNGNFTVRNIRPGNYRAVALEHISTMQLQNPDLLKQLQSMGTAVELKENDRKQISLERVSASDVRALFVKLGIDYQ